MSMLCPKCGKTVGENEKFCGKCGAALNEAPAVQPVAAPKKKSKKGLIVGISLGSAVLLAAAAFILWTFVFNPDIALKDAFQKQQKASKNGDIKAAQEYSYYPVFGGEGELEKSIKSTEDMIKDFPELDEMFKSYDYNILSIADLSSDSISEVKNALKLHGFTDTDAIEDVKVVTYEYRNEKLEEGKRYMIGSCLAIKVRGKWYFNYSTLDSDAPGKETGK